MLQIALWKRLVIWFLCIGGLLLALPNAFYSRVESFNDAKLTSETAEGWPSFLPSSLVNLGLDLRGGAHLLAEVQVADVYEQRMAALWPEVRDLLRNERAKVGTIRLQKGEPNELKIKLSKPEAINDAVKLVETLAKPVSSIGSVGKLDLEVIGENSDLIVRLSEAERRATDDRTMQQALEIIRRRIDEVGTREPTIQRQGTERILIQVPGIGSASELKQLIGTTAQLTFQPVIAARANSDSIAGSGEELLPSLENPSEFYLLDAGAVVTGEVNFRFNPSGARKFGDYTAENIGNPFAIVLDNEVISAPTIQSHIPGGSGIITGSFTIEESTELAVLLRAGALPAGLLFLEERTIGPELGADSIRAGKIACVVAFGAVLIFMAASYGLFGLFANVALLLNVGLIFGLLSGIGATLTLPGIAGIVLTIGMAVDANVLIFERIREELVSAKGPARAIELGYEKAMSAILDANVTTFIAAVILFVMGSGPVRGFSITLGLGIITSVFTAIFVTRLLVVMWFERRRPKTIEV